MSELFNLRNINYDFRSQIDFELGPIYTTAYGLWSLKYLAPKIWNIVPIEIRNSDSLSKFTTKIKSWKPVTRPCSLCCTFVGQVGCIDKSRSLLTILLLQKQPLRCVGLLPGCFSRDFHEFCQYLSNITLLTSGDLGVAAFLGNKFLWLLLLLVFIQLYLFGKVLLTGINNP